MTWDVKSQSYKKRGAIGLKRRSCMYGEPDESYQLLGGTSLQKSFGAQNDVRLSSYVGVDDNRGSHLFRPCLLNHNVIDLTTSKIRFLPNQLQVLYH